MSKREQKELDRLEFKLDHGGLNKQEKRRYNNLLDMAENEQELSWLQGQF